MHFVITLLWESHTHELLIHMDTPIWFILLKLALPNCSIQSNFAVPSLTETIWKLLKNNILTNHAERTSKTEKNINRIWNILWIHFHLVSIVISFFFFNFPKLFSWASFYNICLSGIESKFSVLNKRTLPNEGMRPKKGKGMRSKVNAFWVKPFKIHSVELMSDSLLLNLILNISTNIVRYSHNINIKALSNRGASFYNQPLCSSIFSIVIDKLHF